MYVGGGVRVSLGWVAMAMRVTLSSAPPSVTPDLAPAGTRGHCTTAPTLGQ